MTVENIQEKLNRLEVARLAHINALINKGSSVSDSAGYEEFADLIRALEVLNEDDNVSGIDPTKNDATAQMAHILSPYQAYGANGELLTGSMINGGAVSKKLTSSATSYSIPKNYHNGSGAVSIATQAKTITATTTAQTVTPSSGYFLSKVTVNPVTGKKLYSGTVSNFNYSNQHTFSVGVSLSSSALFFMFADGYTGMNYLAHATYVAKIGSTGTYGATMDGSDFKTKFFSPTISYSGSYVTVSLPGPYYFCYDGMTHYWYVID